MDLLSGVFRRDLKLGLVDRIRSARELECIGAWLARLRTFQRVAARADRDERRRERQRADRLRQQNVARVGYCGLDVTPSASLRVFYLQGWQSQQDFLYLAARIDEFAPSQARLGRTDLEFELNFLNQERDPYRRCLLRNGKSTILTLADIPNGKGWRVYENGTLVKETVAQAGEYIGEPTWIDDEAINICGQFRSSTRMAYTYKRFAGSDWEYFGQGYAENPASYIVGAERVNGTAYAVVVGRRSATEATLSVHRSSASGVALEPNVTWTTAFEETIPWEDLG